MEDLTNMTDEELLAYFKEKNSVASNPVSMVAADQARKELKKRGIEVE